MTETMENRVLSTQDIPDGYWRPKDWEQTKNLIKNWCVVMRIREDEAIGILCEVVATRLLNAYKHRYDVPPNVEESLEQWVVLELIDFAENKEDDDPLAVARGIIEKVRGGNHGTD